MKKHITSVGTPTVQCFGDKCQFKYKGQLGDYQNEDDIKESCRQHAEHTGHCIQAYIPYYFTFEK